MAVSVTDEIRLTQTGEMQYSALDWQRALVRAQNRDAVVVVQAPGCVLGAL